MPRLPWRFALKADRKSALTAVAIGLVSSFAFAGFSLAGTLQGEEIEEHGPLMAQDVLLEGAAIPEGATRVSNVRVAEVPLASGGVVTLARIVGERDPGVPVGEAWTTRTGPVPSSLLLPGGARLTVVRIEPSDRLSPSWFLVDATHDAVFAWALGVPRDYVLLEGPEGGAFAGPDAARVPSVEPFLETSGREVGRDLVLVVVFAGVLVALFSYEFIRSEVAERRREIAVWRSLGMRRPDVVTLIVSRSAVVSAGAGIVGVAICLLALEGSARATGLDAVSLPGASTTLAVFLTIVAAGTVGSVPPALEASRVQVREAMEGGP